MRLIEGLLKPTYSESHRETSCSKTSLARFVPVVPSRPWYLPFKAVVEYVVALILFVLTAPLILLGAILIKLTSPGPAFYLQTRLGKDRKNFRMIKLRTMIHNAEAKTGPIWAQQGDPRITRIGRILRKTHIDEFPQLLNVLMGEMSLIGPRPERPEIASKLSCELERYEERLRVRPGISGLAQLRLPADTDFECVRKKLAYDLYYVKCINPWLDLQLLIFTAWRFAESIMGTACQLIYIPDARTINEKVVDIFGEEIDLTVPSETRH